ncbi:carbohydrate ABC transporter permease, partial [Mycoplasmopsis synoviae]
GSLQDLPWKVVVQNTYTRAFSTGYWNSLIITFLNVLVSVVLKVIVTMLMGYAFSLKNWRGKNVIWYFALALLVLPEIALLSGQLQVVFRLKLNATYFEFV